MDTSIHNFLIETARNDNDSHTNRIAAAQALATQHIADAIDNLLSGDFERGITQIGVELGGLGIAVRDAGR